MFLVNFSSISSILPRREFLWKFLQQINQEFLLELFQVFHRELFRVFFFFYRSHLEISPKIRSSSVSFTTSFTRNSSLSSIGHASDIHEKIRLQFLQKFLQESRKSPFTISRKSFTINSFAGFTGSSFYISLRDFFELYLNSSFYGLSSGSLGNSTKCFTQHFSTSSGYLRKFYHKSLHKLFQKFLRCYITNKPLTAYLTNENICF